MADTFDSLETRDPQQREEALFQQLPHLLKRTQQAPGWARILESVTAAGYHRPHGHWRDWPVTAVAIDR